MASTSERRSRAAEHPVNWPSYGFVLLKYEPAKKGVFHRQLTIKTDLEQEGPQIVTVDASVEP